MNPPRSLNVLLVDDSRDDVLMFQRALQKSGVPHTLSIERDGADAISYLQGTGKYADRHTHPFPNLCVLDMKLPRVEGTDVLKWLVGQSGERNVPVVVLTASDSADDVERAYGLCAKTYFTKPNDFDDLCALVEAIMRYWKLARVPANDRLL